MSKVIKLKQSDIEKIVNNILRESEMDDFDTEIQPEELPDDEMDLSSKLQKYGIDPSELDFEGKHDVPSMLVGKDMETGQIIVTNTKTGEILKPPVQ
jgi:hypothetical protein